MSTALKERTDESTTMSAVRETLGIFGDDLSGVSRRRDIQIVTIDFIDYLIVERNASENTVEAYRRDLRDLVDHIGNQDVDKIEMGHLRSFLKHLHGFNGASTIGRKLSTIRSFLDFCLREGLIEVNISKALKAPKRGKRLPRHESLEGINRLLNAPDESPLGLRDRAILEVMYSAGLRVSELVGLNHEDIDLEAKTVRVIGKGDKQRLAPLGSKAAAALSTWLDVKDGEGAVYTNYQGGRLSTRSVQKLVDKYTAKAGLGKLTPHALRHSMATHLLNNGADIRSVQEMLGHESIASTQIYTHVARTRQAAVHAEFHPRG
jgi:integrase/recombinase XerC